MEKTIFETGCFPLILRHFYGALEKDFFRKKQKSGDGESQKNALGEKSNKSKDDNDTIWKNAQGCVML